MSKPRLTYFDISASRGEECRLALFVAGVDFEDERVKFDNWPTLKPQTPFGSLPTLTVEGKPALAQSNAILGYIGRQHALHPTDAWEAARHEAVLQAVEELRANLAPVLAIKGDTEKKAARETFAAGPLQAWAKSMDDQIQGPFLSGEAIHVADLKLFVMVNAFVSGVYDHLPTDCFASSKKLTGLYQAAKAHPKVAEWRGRDHGQAH